MVFATETLALGINMPARCVVVEKLEKFDGTGHVGLTPGEFTQLTGRAGRRGIDTIGHATRPPSSNKLGARSSSAKGISERPEKSLFIADSCPGFSAVRSVHPVFSGSLAA